LTRAAVEFSRKNARFFAGYAVDAYRVPLAWTPPARVFVEIRLERAVLLDTERGTVLGRWGTKSSSGRSHATFRALRSRSEVLSGVPEDVRAVVAEPGPAALAMDGARGPIVLPCRWAIHRDGMYAALPSSFLGFADVEEEGPAALVIDRASRWRASDMTGVLAQGRADVFDVERLQSGGSSAAGAIRATGSAVWETALVRIRPSRLVWWHGWGSGTVTAD
jgi:hypothetical protein